MMRTPTTIAMPLKPFQAFLVCLDCARVWLLSAIPSFVLFHFSMVVLEKENNQQLSGSMSGVTLGRLVFCSKHVHEDCSCMF